MKNLKLMLTIITYLIGLGIVQGQIPTTGLVGYWKFEGNLDDASTQGNNLIGHNILYESGRQNSVDKCVYLNGSSSYLSNETLNIDLNTSFSLSFWIKVDGLVANRLFSFSNRSATYPIMAGNSANGNIYWNIRTDQLSDFNGTQIQLPGNTWVHVVYVKEGSTLKIYIDNIEMGSDNFSLGTLTNTNIFTVGALAYNNSIIQYLNAHIDDMALYDKALTIQEIDQLFNENSVPPSPNLWNKTGYNIYYNEGKVGIGTTTPLAKLNIEGSSANWNEITPGTGAGTIHLTPGNSSDHFGNAITWSASDAGGAQAGIYIRSDGTYGTKMYLATTDLYVTGAKTRLMINSNGNVGIGTTTPDYKLDVLGTIRATEIKVETGWADFVFEPNYELRTLKDLESFIEENKHLPEIPTAKEVEENGISVGEMNAKLLQKIEELTLYTIKQQNVIEDLQKRLEMIENK